MYLHDKALHLFTKDFDMYSYCTTVPINIKENS